MVVGYKNKRKLNPKTGLVQVTLDAPENICLYDEYFNETVLFLAKLDKIERDPRIQIILEMRDVIFISAGAITKLFNAVAERQLQVSPSHVVVNLPVDKNIRELLRTNGFIKAVMQGGKGKLDALWESSNFVCGSQRDITKFLQKIRALAKRETLPNHLGVAIKESLINVNHHAYVANSKPKTTWWSYIYVGREGDRQYLATVIVDNGKGIANSIRPHVYELTRVKDNRWVHGDGYCIKTAMQESVTSTHEPGRGKGSEDIKRPVLVKSALGQHHLLVLSGSGKYTYEIDENGEVQEQFEELEHRCTGTLIEWFLYFEE
ncbi:MAG: hypothetical protein VX952_08600 [Pseudomonadota bacterium]|nr:hypothetical protein [Pseudomonadota bacterium]|tara:strand:- start:1733 stop:2689 length:957 start_codon:yes stop_codon:yes gene_type:complete